MAGDTTPDEPPRRSDGTLLGRARVGGDPSHAGLLETQRRRTMVVGMTT
jgi:hypothetical protein